VQGVITLGFINLIKFNIYMSYVLLGLLLKRLQLLGKIFAIFFAYLTSFYINILRF
jgi:hypothetical protein